MQPQSLPSQCTCGQTYSVSHALSCPIDGYPTLRHNEVRDFTAGLLREVCHDATTEPPLQPLTGEAFIASSVKRDDQARLDISACGFWGGRFEKAFFGVRVFNPSAPSNQQPQMSATYRKHEKEKRRHYEHRVNEMGAIHKMAPVGVCGALLHTGQCWMYRYGWLREAEKNSPSESYFLLLLLEYAQGDTYRRSLCSKNLKNQARERVRARFFYFFRIDEVSSVVLRTAYNTAEWVVQ